MATIQVRGISDRAHRRLKARAAREGMSLTEYLRVELEHLASLPSVSEIVQRVARREPVAGVSAAEAIHAARRQAGRE
jgi:plasmid stability protein